MKDFFVYILECSDRSYYTGVTSELEKRINEHNSSYYKGYTSSRLPVKLVYSNRFTNVNDAINAGNRLKVGAEQKKKHLLLETLIY